MQKDIIPRMLFKILSKFLIPITYSNRNYLKKKGTGIVATIYTISTLFQILLTRENEKITNDIFIHTKKKFLCTK